MNNSYLILYHKQSTSARTRFLQHGHGGICGIDALPKSASLDPAHGDKNSTLTTHPGMLLRNAESRLKLTRGSLESDLGFRCRVFAEGVAVDVHLAHFVSIDPPFKAAHNVGAAFIDLTQARGLSSTELALLRLAYEHVLG